MPELETDSTTRTVLPRGLSYFEYQRLVCSEVVVPWLAARLDLSGLAVGDFGAHQGGMLDALRESGLVASATGLELSADVVASSPFVGDDRFRLAVADVMSRGRDAPRFDLVLMHDVLEHIPDYEAAVRAVARSLTSAGHLFVSFPPYYSSFGGHQHLARGRARSVPFVHLLPARLFFRIARPGANEYMSALGSHEDMVSVRATRLTLGAAERAFARAGLEIVDRELFLIRPEYTVRYGIRTRRAAVLGRLPLVREAAVNGGFYLVRAPD
jgi:2-polyprenyl-3-methyl-5-hydroxy-6-metoxy-1,4-benzoquinol methylase